MVLDMDRSISETHGEQEDGAYNDHLFTPDTISCSCSISLASWNGASRAQVTYTASTAGAWCWSHWSRVTGTAQRPQAIFSCQTGSWIPKAAGDRQCRMAVWRTVCPRRFIVAIPTRPAVRVGAFYNQSGTAEQWVASHCNPGEVGQDRRQGRCARPLCRLSDRRGGGAVRLVWAYPRDD